jgi:ParB-like chromosome segregation protein Spo0J
MVDLEPPGAVVAMAVGELPVGSLFRADGLCAEHVDRLVELRGSWPPILVGRDGRVIDGAHRVAAARRLGLARLDAVLFEGGPEAAFVEFVRRNVTHGLTLTLAERKRAAARVLRAHRGWSDRRVAELCGLSPKTVARLRAVPRGCPTEEAPHSDDAMREGRDRRLRPLRHAPVRARVADALRARPDASLRAIAAEVGVSPETVRLVRLNLAQMEEGEPAERVVSWRSDAALASSEQAEDFLAWFERTTVNDGDLAWVATVPLSRVYMVADEARRRSARWEQFARALEARPAQAT